MKPQLVWHGNAQFFRGSARLACVNFIRLSGQIGLVTAQMRNFGGQCAARLFGALLGAAARAGAGGGGHHAFNQWGIAQFHAGALVIVQKAQRHLRAHQGAAQIHQHQNAIAGVCFLNRLHHAHGVGANRGFAGIWGDEAPRRDDLRVWRGHLASQLCGPFGQFCAMRDDDDAYHGCWWLVASGW